MNTHNDPYQNSVRCIREQRDQNQKEYLQMHIPVDDVPEGYRIVKKDIYAKDVKNNLAEFKSNDRVIISDLPSWKYTVYRPVKRVPLPIIIAGITIFLLIIAYLLFFSNVFANGTSSNAALARIEGYALYRATGSNHSDAISIRDFNEELADITTRLIKASKISDYPVYIVFRDTQTLYRFDKNGFDPESRLDPEMLNNPKQQYIVVEEL